MQKIHAISDIHGHANEFTQIVEALDLDAHKSDHLVLLGDYIDRGPDSAQVLYLAKELTERFPERVTVLLGNHETDFLGWLDADPEAIDWMLADPGFQTIRTFIDSDELTAIGDRLATANNTEAAIGVNASVQKLIRTQHYELLNWLRIRPLYYETPDQIFVHAGIDEEAGENWKLYTPDHVFAEKYPAQFGPFSKTIIAGHIGTSSMHNDSSTAPYFDGKSHWYIDGEVEKTGQLNVLTYDTDTRDYSWGTGP